MPKNMGFRCPDETLAEIERRMQLTGSDKTATIVAMIEGLPSVKIEHRKTFPAIEATYIVWALDKLLYLGHTPNLQRTFLDHPRLVEFLNHDAKISWFDTGMVDRLEVEPELVSMFSAK